MIQQRFTFKSTEKLKSSKLIGQIFSRGKSFSHFPFRAIYIYPEKNKSHLQTAFSVSSKNFKKAVDRNRIKRVMREASRLQKNSLQKKLEQNQNYLAVFIIYTGSGLPPYEHVFDKMGGLLRRLEKILLSKDDEK
ncbi:MAG: ribonuclease P protein component [Bacteroidota bacterium]|nr:ribonuclease P protein component [Bacteroidota bacterium]